MSLPGPISWLLLSPFQWAVFKAEKGNKCQQASSWLPGGRLVQKEGAEWATSDGAKLSQGGEHEQEADFISLLIKKTRQLQNDCFWHWLTQPAGLGAGIPEAGSVAKEGGA